MVLVKANIDAKKIDVQTTDFETCSIQCRAKGNPITIIAAYVPNGSKVKYRQLQKFFSQFKTSIIVGGDLNARHTGLNDSKCNSNGVNVYKLHNDGQLKVITAQHPTCHRSENGSFIDHFMISPDLADIVSHRAENIVRLSDHTGISIYADIELDYGQSKSIFSRKMYDKADLEAINLEINDKLDKILLPATANVPCAELELIVSTLHETFQAVIEKYVPSTTSRFDFRISKRSISLLQENR